MAVRVDSVFAGRVGLLSEEGHPSAIVKHAMEGEFRIGIEGLEGDEQADRRNHGGPDRALNHYPADHYPYWQAAFPGARIRFEPGAFGENLSTRRWTEAEAYVGDSFRFGDAVIQIAQPRFPCWKLGQHAGVDDMAREVVATGRSGWLYRVLEPGVACSGDELVPCDEHPARVSIAELWEIQNTHRPELAALERAAGLEPLAEAWRRRFRSRLQWLSS